MDCREFHAKIEVTRHTTIGRSEISALRAHAEVCRSCSRWLKGESQRHDHLIELARQVTQAWSKRPGRLAGFFRFFRL